MSALVGQSAPRAEASEQPANAFARDERGRRTGARSAWTPARDRLVAFVGKLIVSKGVDLLIAAWPLVLERVPRARLVVVGFGAYREGSSACATRFSVGDIDQAREIALAGRALEEPSPGPQPLRHLLAFFDSLQAQERERYLVRGAGWARRVLFTGRLDHEELAELLPACEALVVPSTFPESFGMVAAEAAACGVLPISAAHSGLAEVSDALARAVPEQAAEWLSFPVDDDAVRALAARVVGWLLRTGRAVRTRRVGRHGARALVVGGVARGVIAAARGELDGSGKAVSGAGRSPAAAGDPSLRIVLRALMSLIPLHLRRWRPRDGPRARTRVRASAVVCWPAGACTAGCRSRAHNANLILGKQHFVAKCGACHTLARATPRDRRTESRQAFRVASPKRSSATRSTASWNIRFASPTPKA